MQGEIDRQSIISVIIPTYKPGEYLWQCLQSLDKQVLAKDKFEVIIILNGCNQPFKSQLDDYIKKLASLNIKFVHTEDGGVSNARNIGLDMSVGEYVTFVDDDDFVSPSYLKELLDKVSPDTVAISNELRYNEKDDTSSEESWSIEYKKKAPQGKQPYPGTRKFFSGPCMKLLHRDVIASYRFDKRFTNGEDSLFMFSISANMKYVDFTSPEAIYYRRSRSGSAMSKERSAKNMIRNRFRLMKEFVRIYCTNPKAYSLHFLMTRLLGCLHSIMNSLKPSILFT